MNDPDEVVRLQIEMWKQTISVQQHFNDICWRIRGLALTALTFSVGAAAVAAQQSQTVRFFGATMRLGALLAGSGLVLWLAFYFVDQVWYHRLLVGAVKHGEKLEQRIKREVPGAGLTQDISVNSAFTFRLLWLHRVTLHSKDKLAIFYRVVAVLLLLLTLALQVGGNPPAKSAAPTPAAQSSSTPQASPATR